MKRTNKVSALVQAWVNNPFPEYQHVQTVKISQHTHMLLRELARVAGRTKTELASELLQAAIQDAVDSLPNEPGTGGGMGDAFGLRDEVTLFAEDAYRQYVQERNQLVDEAVDRAAVEVPNG